jgi:hypothetical protein
VLLTTAPATSITSSAEKALMWERAKFLLERAPYSLVARPLAGALIGLALGALYGALCGALHAALRATPGLFMAWFLRATVAGLGAGFIMGVATALDRAAWRLVEPKAPPHNRLAKSSANGRAKEDAARADFSTAYSPDLN